MTPSTHPGLLGICLSGAGPTILALVSKPTSISNGTGATTSEMSDIGNAIKALWQAEGIEVEWKALEVDFEGSTMNEITVAV